MPKVSFSRDSLCFKGRRTARGIEIEADFLASKLSNPDEGPEVCYSVTLIINPVTRGVTGEWTGSRQGQEYAHGGGKDRLRELEKLIRDEALKSEAWTVLVNREPDPNFIVDECGRTVPPPAPIIRRRL